MKSRINKILEEIENKKNELYQEYNNLKEKYNFDFIKWKVTFSEDQKLENQKKKKSVWETIFSKTIREILSIPFIYAFIIPAIILDISIFIYQNTAIRLYKIPLAKRSDYINLDRKHLDYLNWIEKINCIYCSYVNGLLSYAVEVAWRTEKYWCPIKHARKEVLTEHSWQKYFADYGDADGFRQVYTSNKEYYENLKNEEKNAEEKKEII